MNTFFVRAYKKKRRRRRRNTFETWTRKRENGFRKNTSKKGEIKEKQKNHCSLRLTSSLLFFYSSSSFISRFFRSRARRARVNHSRIGRKRSSTSPSFVKRDSSFSFDGKSDSTQLIITFLDVLIFSYRWRTLFPKNKSLLEK